VRHAVLGAGGIGSLLAAALARSGEEVTLIMRPASIGRYPGRIGVASVVLGEFEVSVPAAAALPGAFDVLWVATKATDLVDALALAPPEAVGNAVVVPLLNGVDHVALLRDRYASVVPGVIRVEAERTEPGHVLQPSPFVRAELAGAEPVAVALRSAGIECVVRADEATMLWEKLVFLGPVALATTARAGPLGAVRDDPAYLRCGAEYVEASLAAGASVDLDALRSLLAVTPDTMRSSMQKDLACGRPPELDAIAGPVLRLAEGRGVEVPATSALAAEVARASRRS
jgi:2-dehydropantoate 2-reductase